MHLHIQKEKKTNRTGEALAWVILSKKVQESRLTARYRVKVHNNDSADVHSELNSERLQTVKKTRPLKEKAEKLLHQGFCNNSSRPLWNDFTEQHLFWVQADTRCNKTGNFALFRIHWVSNTVRPSLKIKNKGISSHTHTPLSFLTLFCSVYILISPYELSCFALH